MVSRFARILVNGQYKVVDLLKRYQTGLIKVWHYEANTASPPWSEIQQLRTDQLDLVTSPVYPGTTRSARFNVKPGDTGWHGTSGTLRSEVRASEAESGSPGEGVEQWWAWPTFFPANFDWDEKNQFLYFTQWHQTANSGNPNMGLWSDSDEVVQLSVKGGTGGVASGDAQYDKTYSLKPIVRGTWNNFIVHVIWSTNPAVGLVEVYQNNALVHSAHDATLYVGQSAYIKQGIYSAAGTTHQQVVYHGPLRLGKTRASVQNVPVLR